MKFTFKTTKPTGQFRSFSSTNYDIKIKGKVVGTFRDETPISIRLMVIKDDITEDGNPNCIWKWITLKQKFDSVMDAKEYLQKHFEAINTYFNLHKLES